MKTYATCEEAEADTVGMLGWDNVRVVQEAEPDITGEQRWYILADIVQPGGGMRLGTYAFDADGHAEPVS